MGTDRAKQAGAIVAQQLRNLGVKGILVQAAEEGHITELKCAMEPCYFPEELGGPRYFDRLRHPQSDWMPTPDHYPLLKSQGGKLTVDNVRLAHRLCNRAGYSAEVKRSMAKDEERVGRTRLLHQRRDEGELGLENLMRSGLPLNRKERFYTGTVFPAIVGCDDLAHVDRLLDCLRLSDVDVVSDHGFENVQFFTEYGFGESRMTDARFADFGFGRDTPDIVLFLAGESRKVLIGLEGKMYDTPDAAELESQVGKQREILSYVAERIQADVVVAALIPQALAERVGELSVSILTWEQVADVYRDVAPQYWLSMLDFALDEYESLVSRGPDFGANKDAELTGAEIAQGFGGEDFQYTWMGRAGGLDGTRMADDLATGRWRVYRYECRSDPLPGRRNWFPIEKFIGVLKQRGIEP